MKTEAQKRAQSKWQHERKVCRNIGGETCTARNGATCIALMDTRFPGGVCPFYRDRTKMTDREIDVYESYVLILGGRE